jgi:hypothetical protein
MARLPKHSTEEGTVLTLGAAALGTAADHYQWPGWFFGACLVVAGASFLFVLWRVFGRRLRPGAVSDAMVVQTGGKSRYKNTHVKGPGTVFEQSGGELQSEGLYVDRESGGEEVEKHKED